MHIEDPSENLWNTYTKLQRGKRKTRKQIVQDYPAWKKKRANPKATQRIRLCAIDAQHVEIVRKTFKDLPKPTSAESNCAILSKFFQLPRSIEIRSSFSHSNPQPQFFVYSALDHKKRVVIKVANLQKEKKGFRVNLVNTTRFQFDFMVLTHKAIKKSLRSGFYVPKCGMASTNNFVGFNIMEHVDGAQLASKMKSSSAIRRDLMTKLGTSLAHLHKIGSHGDAHFENILVTPSGKLCLIDFERALVFRQTKASPFHKNVSRLFDLMVVTVSIFSKGRVRVRMEEIVGPNPSRMPDLMSFVEAYHRVVVKYLSKQELSQLRVGHAEFLYRVKTDSDPLEMFLAFQEVMRIFRIKAAKSLN